MENQIQISKYLYFDTEYGRFYLTNEAQEIIYRQKEIICSYSGSNEWANHFACELIDLYTGASQYNYALGTIIHEKEIPEIWKTNKESVIGWVNKFKDQAWAKSAFSAFDMVIDTLPGN